MVLKKRQLVTAALVMALGAAVFVNWYYTKPDAKPADVAVTQAAENLGDAQYVISDVSGKEDPFAEARLKRERTHSEIQETLQAVIKDTASTEAARTEATVSLSRLTERMALEADLETLIEAKTGMDSLVILGEDTAEVLLSDRAKDGTVMVQVSELVTTKTGYGADKVTIIESKQ